MKMNIKKYCVELSECLSEIKKMCLNIAEYNPTDYEYVLKNDDTIYKKVEKITDIHYSTLEKLYFVADFMTSDDMEEQNAIEDLKDVVKIAKARLRKALINGAYDEFYDEGEKYWRYIMKEVEMCNDDIRAMLTV